MSVRAYKVITKKTKDSPTFNISDNIEVCNQLGIWEQLGDNGSGDVYIDRNVLEDAIKEAKAKNKPYLYILEAILSDFDKDDDGITYSCF